MTHAFNLAFNMLLITVIIHKISNVKYIPKCKSLPIPWYAIKLFILRPTCTVVRCSYYCETQLVQYCIM